MITVISDYSLDNMTIFPVDAPFHFSIKKHFLKKATVSTIRFVFLSRPILSKTFIIYHHSKYF